MTYPQAIQYSQSLLRFGMDLGLEPMAELLRRLKNPHLRYRHVHIAGTNGKGSTTAFMTSILQEAGYRVGRYMSPHVYDLRERMMVDGRMIPEADFSRIVAKIKPHIEDLAASSFAQITEFELLTAVAFQYFAEKEVEFAVLEVGLGGRLDSTNVIPPPLVAVITQIGLDHQRILGDTLAQIAAEKAGILKPGTVCLTAVDRPEAIEVIEQIAKGLEVPLYQVLPGNQLLGFEALPDGLNIHWPGGKLENLHLTMPGPFQHANAALAAGVAWQLGEQGIEIGLEAMRRGLEKARLPGRFEVLQMKNGLRLILDVGHNADGARVLAQALESTFPGQKFHFVVGMTAGHEPSEFFPPLRGKIAKLWAIELKFRPRPLQDLLDVAARLKIRSEAGVDLENLLRNLEDSTLPVVVTGSFYTVAEVPPDYRGFQEN